MNVHVPTPSLRGDDDPTPNFQSPTGKSLQREAVTSGIDAGDVGLSSPKALGAPSRADTGRPIGALPRRAIDLPDPPEDPSEAQSASVG